jgi:hypothetical protein
VLPDWFDLQVLRLIVAGATVATALSAILAVALFRRVPLRAGFAVVLLGCTAALLFYYQGPLQDCEDTCDCKFLRSEIPVAGCVNPDDVAINAASRTAR